MLSLYLYISVSASRMCKVKMKGTGIPFKLAGVLLNNSDDRNPMNTCIHVMPT